MTRTERKAGETDVLRSLGAPGKSIRSTTSLPVPRIASTIFRPILANSKTYDTAGIMRCYVRFLFLFGLLPATSFDLPFFFFASLVTTPLVKFVLSSSKPQSRIHLAAWGLSERLKVQGLFLVCCGPGRSSKMCDNDDDGDGGEDMLWAAGMMCRAMCKQRGTKEREERYDDTTV